MSDFLHELVDEIHVFDLMLCQHVHVFWNLKENCCHSVPPLVEEILLIDLCIHQFVHNVQLKIELFSINCVLRWIMEMKLDATSNV